MDKYNCEMVHNNLCLGCTGLEEKDWVGKYKCEYYQKIKKEIRNDYKNSFISKKQKEWGTNI